MKRAQIVPTVLLMLTLWFSTAGHLLPFTFEATQRRGLTSWWRDSSVSGDAAAYLDLAHGIDSGPPYRYRVLPIWAAQAIGLPPELGFIAVNLASFVATGLLMVGYTMRVWRFTYEHALFAAVLAVTTVSLQSTLLLPMVDAMSYPFGVALVWAMFSKRPWVFGVVCSLAVATKEVFIVAVPVYALIHMRDYYAASRLPVRRFRTLLRLRSYPALNRWWRA